MEVGALGLHGLVVQFPVEGEKRHLGGFVLAMHNMVEYLVYREVKKIESINVLLRRIMMAAIYLALCTLPLGLEEIPKSTMPLHAKSNVK